MYAMIAISSLLAGWVIRRKAADALKIRRANQRARATRRADAVHRGESWRQILEVRV